ncbi:hypothetical protein V7S43_000548 [Phytophthora oleae]|uniref:Uncharacterized protein n=1 Tax=Phytophthora oleae TaxID=2107226 RepID=A0ABD3G9X8_9STRA
MFLQKCRSRCNPIKSPPVLLVALNTIEQQLQQTHWKSKRLRDVTVVDIRAEPSKAGDADATIVAGYSNVWG